MDRQPAIVLLAVIAALATAQIVLAATCPPLSKPELNPYLHALVRQGGIVSVRVLEDGNLLALVVPGLQVAAPSTKVPSVKLVLPEVKLPLFAPGHTSYIILYSGSGVKLVNATLPYTYLNLTLTDRYSNVFVAYGGTRASILSICGDACINIVYTIDACNNIVGACVYKGMVWLFVSDGRIIRIDPVSLESRVYRVGFSIDAAYCVPEYTSMGVYSTRYVLLLHDGKLTILDQVGMQELTTLDIGVTRVFSSSFSPETLTIYIAVNAGDSFRAIAYNLLGVVNMATPTCAESVEAIDALTVNGVFAVSLETMKTVIFRLGGECVAIPGLTKPLIAWPPRTPRYVLLADVELGTFRVYSVEGRGVWVKDWGVPAAQPILYNVAGYTRDKLILYTLEGVDFLDVQLIPVSLVSARVGLLFRGKPVPFHARIECVTGECMVLRHPILVSSSRIVIIPLPPGIYHVVFKSKYGVATLTRSIVDYGVCKVVKLDSSSNSSGDVELVASIEPSRLRVCVYSAGDPQGWGFGAGPLQDALVQIASNLGYTDESRTGANGCVVFQDIPPGVYTISVSASGYSSASLRVDLPQGSKKSVNVTLTPHTALVTFYTVDAEVGFEIKNATITIRDTRTGKSVDINPGAAIRLPIGSYVVMANHPYYNPSTPYTLEVKPNTSKVRITIPLAPIKYHVVVHVKLSKMVVAGRNITVILEYQRLWPVKSSVERVVAWTKNATAMLSIYVPWGGYALRVIAPYHNPLETRLVVPRETVVGVTLTTANYTLIIEVYDSVTKATIYNAHVLVLGVGGFRVATKPFHYIRLPTGNYTLIVSAEFYNRGVTRVNLRSDTRVAVRLTPLLYVLRVEVVKGREKVPNATVVLEGLAFNGVKIHKEARTDKHGVVEFRVPAGNYTITAWAMMQGINVTSMTVVELEKSERVRLHLVEPLIVIILTLLPYIIIIVAAVVLAVIFIAARRALRERIRKLRQLLVERFGGPPPGGEEEEELF